MKYQLQRRLLLAALIPVMLVTIGIAAIFTRLHQEEMENGLLQQGKALSGQLVAASDFALFAGNRELLGALSDSLMRANPSVAGIAVLDAEGQPVIQRGELRPADWPAAGNTLAVVNGANRIVLSAPVIPATIVLDDDMYSAGPPDSGRTAGPSGHVVLELSREDLESHQEEVVQVVLLAALTGILIGTALAMGIARGLTRPMANIADTVERIARGEPGARAEETGAGIVRPLAEGINRMWQQVTSGQEDLRRAYDELESYRHHLEDLVLERTRELRAASDEAERLAQIKGTFLANMSHEIRTPLNAVLGFAQVGLRDADTEQGRVAFARILESGQLLLGIVDDVLDFSKIEAGKLVVERGRVNLGLLLDQAVALVGGGIERKGLEFVLEEGPGLPAFFAGDALRVTQILGNLLSNATKFTARGTITLAVAAVEGEIEFSVADTGIGIPPATMASLFEPFVQADASTTRHFGGTGLGLTISRRLATMLGGELMARSEPGLGSRFVLRLPLDEPDGSLLPRSRRGQIASGMPSRQRRLAGIRLLSAEDNPMNRLVLESMVTGEGGEIVSVADGGDALACLVERGVDAFDAVLTDVQMPGMDGYELATRIAAMAPALPVIGVTAHAMADEAERCRAAGMVDRLTKPVDLERLVSVVLVRVSGIAAPAGLPLSAPVLAAAKAAGIPEGLLVSEQVILERIGGNRDVLPKMVAVAVESIADVPRRLRDGLAAGDREAMAFSAHYAKGTAGYLELPWLHALALAAEQAAKGGAPDLAERIEVLAQAVERLIADLNRLASTLGS